MVEPLASKELSVPPAPTEQVRSLWKHGGEIVAIRVSYVMTGVDTSKTVWDITLGDEHRMTIDESTAFAELFDFYPSTRVPKWRAIASLKEPLVKMCEERSKWEKSNAAELATFKRLKQKFEGTP